MSIRSLLLLGCLLMGSLMITDQGKNTSEQFI